MLYSVKKLVSTGFISLMVFSAASVAHAGNLKSPTGASSGEPECKPEWTRCVCLYKPLGDGKTCWNDTLASNSNSSNSSNQRVRTKTFSIKN